MSQRFVEALERFEGRRRPPTRTCAETGGLEVRCGYGPDDLLRSQAASEIGTAREVAEQWRQAVLAKGRFIEVR